MANEWPTVRLGDYVNANLGKMLDAQKNKGVPRPYLGNSNVRWGSFDLNDLALMKFEEGEDERYGVRDGDLIVCEGGEPGRCAVWREQVPDMKIQKALHRIRPKVGLNNYYLFYWFMLAGRTGWLEPFFTGTTIKHLTGKALNELEVPLPPIEEQRAIAHILSTLDDKIELNRQQNETLEAMARTLFKAWFVDFEPVRAKQEGRWQRGQSLPGLSAQLYDLFPDRLVESELGEIPEGWRHSTIGAEVTVCGGSTPSTKEPEYWDDGQHCWATPKDLSALKFPVLLDTDRKVTDAGLAKISSGLLPVGTVLLSSRAPIGYLAIAEVTTAINQGFIAMKCDGVLPNVFVLAWCRESMDAIVGNANGSTFQEISKSNFRPIPVVVPSDPILESYRKSADSLYRQMAENERESRSLAQLRDTLLPRLISGELRVPDVERLLGEVAQA